MPYAVQSEIVQHCGDNTSFSDYGIVVVTLPENCDLTLDPILISEALTALGSYTELERDLTRRLADLEGKLTNLESYVRATRDIVARLAALAN